MIQFIDNFHQKVFEILSPLIKNEKSLEYLKRKTKPLKDGE